LQTFLFPVFRYSGFDGVFWYKVSGPEWHCPASE
jgi:hypothetical protein